jgi:hypothetical protein
MQNAIAAASAVAMHQSRTVFARGRRGFCPAFGDMEGVAVCDMGPEDT